MTTDEISRDRMRIRARGMRVAGVLIILLSAGAALLPAGKGLSADVIGGLLIAAGLVETLAGTLRREIRPYTMAAGGVTALAGLLFLVNPETHFFPMVWPIVGWLVLRGVILGIGSTQARGSVRTWTGLSAGMDLCLAALLIAGLSIATIVVSIFGPTGPLIASFAWILAASFVVNGLLMLDVASCEDDNAIAA
ncbi:hypothetical protein [Sphingomonas sp.]|uniref:hypothetical protein n=1 Tax=Sphingomonas sp. TaxID=28214 RepID=UPI0025E7E872|nr:hypothetical protein [Sphingomonas sp.]MBV9526772.1 hypothetical protein [Sphingomonas sp.]